MVLHLFVHHDYPLAKRGSGGLLCYKKKEIQEGVVHLSVFNSSEDRLWIRLKADFFRLSTDVFICFVYISRASSCHIASPLDSVGRRNRHSV